MSKSVSCDVLDWLQFHDVFLAAGDADVIQTNVVEALPVVQGHLRATLLPWQGHNQALQGAGTATEGNCKCILVYVYLSATVSQKLFS